MHSFEGISIVVFVRVKQRESVVPIYALMVASKYMGPLPFVSGAGLERKRCAKQFDEKGVAATIC